MGAESFGKHEFIKSAKFYEAAKQSYREARVDQKSNTWSTIAVIEYANCCRLSGNALIECGNTEEAVSSWRTAHELYRNGGIISAASSVAIRIHPELAMRADCVAGRKQTSANLSLFQAPAARNSDTLGESTNIQKNTEALFLFPYSNCGIYQIESESKSQFNWWELPVMKGMAKLEHYLRSDYQPRIKNVDLGYTVPARNSNLMPQVNAEALQGKSVVFCFGPGWTPQTPFPFQCFTTSDLTKFQNQLKADDLVQHNVQVEMQNYLEKKWTIPRIKDFCRADTRRAVARDAALRIDNIHNASEHEVAGKLHAAQQNEIGEIIWICSTEKVLDGPLRPSFYCVYVKKSQDTWILEMNTPRMFPWEENDFLKHRLRTTLLLCLDAERFLKLPQHPWYVSKEADIEDDTIHRSLAMASLYDEQLLRSDGAVTYTCKLSDGNVLSVALDKDQSIETIQINHKPDCLWNEAYSNLQKNLATICRQEKMIEGVRDSALSMRVRNILSVIILVLASLIMVVILCGFVPGIWICDLCSQFRIVYETFLVIALIVAFGVKGRAAIALCFIGIILNGLPIATMYLARNDIPSGQKKLLSILNYNTEFQHNDHYAQFEQLLKERNPDVLTLVEVNQKWIDAIAAKHQKLPLSKGCLDRSRTGSF